jgi:hypothetical protein
VRWSRDRQTVTFRKEEREVLAALAARVRKRGLNETAHRAAVLHSDVVTVATSIATPSGAEAGAQTRGVIGDGTGMRGGQRLHWELARAVLTYVQLEILQEFRRRYLITFTPTGVARAGWHKLDVRVKRSGTRVQARSGYVSSAP